MLQVASSPIHPPATINRRLPPSASHTSYSYRVCLVTCLDFLTPSPPGPGSVTACRKPGIPSEKPLDD